HHDHGIRVPFSPADNAAARSKRRRFEDDPPDRQRRSTVSAHARKSPNTASRVVAIAIGLAPAAVFAAGSCPVNLDDVKAKISSFANKTDSEDSGVKKDFEAATNKDYAKKFFDTFEQLNK